MTSDSADQLLKLCDPESLNLILVRHGQAGGKGKHAELLGPVLSDLGEQQATLVAQRLADLPLSHIYASDIARSHQTATAVAEYHPQTPFSSLPEIREIAGFQLRHREVARTRLQREQLHQERQSVKRFAQTLRSTHKSGQLVAIVGHNGVNGMLLAELNGLSYRKCICHVCSHTGVTVANVALDGPYLLLRLMGCTSHLPPDRISNHNRGPDPWQEPTGIMHVWRKP